MTPAWVTVAAWVSPYPAFLSAAPILLDAFVRGYRQDTRVMETVWPVTAPYCGPLALWAYGRWGRDACGYRGRA